MNSKKTLAIILSTIGIGINVLTCVIPKEILLTVEIREKRSNVGYIIIDDEVIALSRDPEVLNQAAGIILNDINTERAAAGLGALIQTEKLIAAATIRAKEQEKLFSHTRPDGTDWWTCDSSVCYGECLSKGYNENEVMTAWMNSPTHKAVIMDGAYKTAGIGVYENDATCFIALETGY